MTGPPRRLSFLQWLVPALLVGLAVAPVVRLSLWGLVEAARAIGGAPLATWLASPAARPLSAAVAQLGVLALAWLAVRSRPGTGSAREALGVGPLRLSRRVFLVLALGVPSLMDLLGAAAIGVAHAEPGGLAPDPPNALLLAVVLAVLPALSEEVVFRGYVQRRLLRVTGPAVAIGLSSLLFAVAHTTGSVESRLVSGALLGILAWRTGNVWTSVAAHAVFNGSLVLLAGYPSLRSAVMPWLLLAELGVAVAAVLLFVRLPPAPPIDRVRPDTQGALRRLSSLRPTWRWSAGPATGLLLVAAFPTGLLPNHLAGAAGWVALVPLFVVLRRATPASALGHGLAAGLVFGVGAHTWLATALVGTFHLSWGAALIAVLVHGALIAPQYGLAAWLIRMLREVRVPWIVCAPVVIAGVEAVYPRLFPSNLGNTQSAAPVLLQIADVFGVQGLSAVMAMVAAAAALWVRPREVPARPAVLASVWAAAAVVLTVGYGSARMAQIEAAMADAPTVRVGVVQPGIGVLHGDVGPAQLLRQSRALEARGADLLVWPEGALRETLSQGGADGALGEHGLTVPLVFGAGSRGEAGLSYNSAWLIAPSGEMVHRYDKVHRFPVGEYQPVTELRARLRGRRVYAGLAKGNTRGEVDAVLASGDTLRLALTLCYEGALPLFVNGIRSSDLLLVLANDGWFGDTAERDLHVQLTLPRAIEQRRTLVRSSVSGISVIVAPTGRVLATSRELGPDTLLADAPILDVHTLYSRWGDLVARLAFALAVLGAVVRLRRGPMLRAGNVELAHSVEGLRAQLS